MPRKRKRSLDKAGRNATAHVFQCFVVMPFSETEHQVNGKSKAISRAEWNAIYKDWIQRAVESYSRRRLRCKISPAEPGNFVKGIIFDLHDADIVIADLTGLKPNVFYELGIRHALQAGTIMITQDISTVPSDLRSYYTFEYSYSNEHHIYERLFADFQSDLHSKIDSVFDCKGAADNPVADFLGHRSQMLQHHFEREKAQLIQIIHLLKTAIREGFSFCSFLHSAIFRKRAVGSHIVCDMLTFDLLYQKFILSEWQVLPTRLLDSVYEVVSKYRNLFLALDQSWKLFLTHPGNPASQGLPDFVNGCRALNTKEQRKFLNDVLKEAENLKAEFTVSPNKASKRL